MMSAVFNIFTVDINMPPVEMIFITTISRSKRVYSVEVTPRRLFALFILERKVEIIFLEFYTELFFEGPFQKLQQVALQKELRHPIAALVLKVIICVNIRILFFTRHIHSELFNLHVLTMTYSAKEVQSCKCSC